MRTSTRSLELCASVALVLAACNGERGARTTTAGAGAASVDAPSATSPEPEPAPVKLGAPRSFHFVVPMKGIPQAVVTLDTANRAASRGWVNAGEPIDTSSEGPGRGVTAGIRADTAKLPRSLRLAGVSVHLYAEDTLLCDGVLGTARVGAVGEAGVVARYSDPRRDDPGPLLEPDVERVLLYQIDVSPECEARFRAARARVAWARDAELGAPVIVGRSVPATDPAARKAVNLVRARPSFVRAQKSLDVALANVHLTSEPVERRATWTAFTWGGERRAHLSTFEPCPPPQLRFGADFRERPDGSVELLRERASELDGPRDLVAPVVLVDVDADGRLEVIEADDTHYQLRAFEGGESLDRLEIESCR